LRKKSDLPFGSEFSPSQVELPALLELAHKHGGDWHAFEDAVRERYFESHQTSDYNRGKLANNTKLGMIAYGVIDRDAHLTPFGKLLYGMRHSDDKLYAELGKHILLNLHGITLVQCVLDIQTAGETATLVKLRVWLDERGVHYPRGGKHPSMMRLWLEKAGVFGTRWHVNQERFRELVGMTTDEIDVLSSLSPEQQAFLRTLVNMGGDGPYPSNDIEKLASATYGIKFNEKGLPRQVLYPLQEAGYIGMERGTKKPGRGAKPFMVSPTEKLIDDVLLPLLDQLEKQVGSDIRPLLRKPLASIRAELNSKNKHIKGLALEALAFKLMRLVDLDYVATRLRGTATGGAEVDIIFESTRLVFSRWQVQCKNTSRVSLDDVAKEVGLTHMLKSNVIVIVSTGTIGPEARRYANRIMTDSNLCIVMVDGNDIDRIEGNPAAIVDVFYREARQTMKLKTLEV
jgi:restriction endonuclease